MKFQNCISINLNGHTDGRTDGRTHGQAMSLAPLGSLSTPLNYLHASGFRVGRDLS